MFSRRFRFIKTLLWTLLFSTFFYPLFQEPIVPPQKPKSTEEVTDTVENEPTEEDLKKPRLIFSTRMLFTVICFISLFNLSFLRVGISMALVCLEMPVHEEIFTWSSAVKGYIISAAFYGFLIGPFVGGVLSFKVGGKITLIVGALVCGVLNFAIPYGIKLTPVFITLRVVIGFFAGFTFPAIYDLFSHWIVPEERQLLVTGALVGIPAASIVNFPICSFICQYLGWIWLFYIFAIWLTLFGSTCFFLLYNYPKDCPFISQAERVYIEKRIPQAVKQKIPWKAILKSLPIHAYVIIHFSVNYFYLTMAFSLPLIMEDIYELSLSENGLLSSTPFMGALVVRVCMSLLFEYIRKKLKLSKNALRKSFVFLGAVLSSSFLIILTFLYPFREWALTCFILSGCALELCLTGGYLLSLLDLCPGYVNVLTGLTNTIGNAAGLICPVVNGLITPHGTKLEWNNVFYVNVGILMASMIFYLVFGKNDIQPWAVPVVGTLPIPRPSLVT